MDLDPPSFLQKIIISKRWAVWKKAGKQTQDKTQINREVAKMAEIIKTADRWKA